MNSVVFLLVSAFLLTPTLIADVPPPNTIPVVGLKPAFDEIDVEFFCFLSWNNFDGLSRQFYPGEDIQAKLVVPGDSTGMLTVVNPNELTLMIKRWARVLPFTEAEPYAWNVWKNYTFNRTRYSEDGVIGRMTVSQCIADMQERAAILDTMFNQETHSVWFYYGFDEAPAFQWARMLVDTIGGTPAYNNDFIPNLFTQAMDSVYRPELGLSRDIVWQPALEEVDPRGTLSWMNWYLKQADPSREIGYIISCMHTLDDWAGATNINEGYDSIPPNSHNQAQAVRAILNMQFLGEETDAVPQNNHPSFIALDAYPYRHVGTRYQTRQSYTQTLGDSLEYWLIDHYEEVMDSTFITVWNIRNSDNKDISVFFVPQSFGRAGGWAMWDSSSATTEDYSLNYDSYSYRIPTPQEFRLTCNSALIRQAKALFPFCLVSYKSVSADYNNIGFFDRNNMPFDAPYEEWVYLDRLRSDIDYIPPDLIAPFIEGYDPLYSLPARPTTTGAKETEEYLEWKFAAYARLWNSAILTLGDIARVAPELSRLWWWVNNEDKAQIDYDGTEPAMFIPPQIKVFTDSTESTCYLYYLNRFCRANENPFEIVVDSSDFPVGTAFSVYALDHNRRFLIEGTRTESAEFTFLDTLDAGEARLLEMVTSSNLSYRDVRITDPDLTVILPVHSDTLTDYRTPPGETVNICAMFYNMGMSSLTDVEVYLFDDTDGELLDTQNVSFTGLDTDSCYKCDRDDAVFSWTPDSNDIGVHRLRVYTEPIFLEHDSTDNTARLVYLVVPGDYAAEELENPWDMTEALTSPPLWKTDDIIAIDGSWSPSGFSDSISGMFEGELSTSITGNILRGDLSLATDSSEPIDTEVYSNFTFAAVCLNPNPNSSPTAGVVPHLFLVDSHGDTTSVNLGNEDDIGAIWNGDSLWREYGPIDLNTVSGLNWSEMEPDEFWLSFRTGKPSPPSIPQPVAIRLGWVKLTE